MSKAKQIMALYDGKRTTREIADIVGCLPEYVRIVARQRRGAGLSEADKRYSSSSLGKETARKYKSDNLDAARSYAATRRRVLKKTGDKEKAKEKGRAAYKAARNAGKTVQEAASAYTAAQRRALCETGDIHRANLSARASFALLKKRSEVQNP
jgi:hypothetical protein